MTSIFGAITVRCVGRRQKELALPSRNTKDSKEKIGFSRGAPEKKTLFEVSFFGIKIDEYEYKNIIRFIQ